MIILILAQCELTIAGSLCHEQIDDTQIDDTHIDDAHIDDTHIDDAQIDDTQIAKKKTLLEELDDAVFDYVQLSRGMRNDFKAIYTITFLKTDKNLNEQDDLILNNVLDMIHIKPLNPMDKFKPADRVSKSISLIHCVSDKTWVLCFKTQNPVFALIQKTSFCVNTKTHWQFLKSQ